MFFYSDYIIIALDQMPPNSKPKPMNIDSKKNRQQQQQQQLLIRKQFWVI